GVREETAAGTRDVRGTRYTGMAVARADPDGSGALDRVTVSFVGAGGDTPAAGQCSGICRPAAHLFSGGRLPRRHRARAAVFASAAFYRTRTGPDLRSRSGVGAGRDRGYRGGPVALAARPSRAVGELLGSSAGPASCETVAVSCSVAERYQRVGIQHDNDSGGLGRWWT